MDADSHDLSRYVNIGELANDMIQCLHGLQGVYPWNAPIDLCERAVVAYAALAGQVVAHIGVVRGIQLSPSGVHVSAKTLMYAWSRLRVLCVSQVGEMRSLARSQERHDTMLKALTALDRVWSDGLRMLHDHYKGEGVL